MWMRKDKLTKGTGELAGSRLEAEEQVDTLEVHGEGARHGVELKRNSFRIISAYIIQRFLID